MAVEGHIIEYPEGYDTSGRSLKFLYFNEIEDLVAAQYDDAVVRGRSEPHLFFSHTSANTFAFSVQLAASVDESDNGDPKILWDDYLFFKSFQYPDYGDDDKGPIAPPKKAIITIGNWFRKVGVIRDPSGTFKPPYDSDGYPYHIDIRFTFRIINPVPLSMFDVRFGL